ncbi:MAG: protein-glutamate O-methyltransferase CheR [Candidatus Eremiobacteraeota bacterium]|nr:protein-glutamate O-methyltransferase CheR [Candidatus Eremiobacteraeota bacterium]
MVDQVIEQRSALPDIELNLLLEAVLQHTGQDYRDYAQATLKRRVAERMRAEEVRTISGLQEAVLHDNGALGRFMLAMSGGSPGLFREPEFFEAFRQRVVPVFRTYPLLRLWFPNCSSGEDVYAAAAVLHEAGLLERCMIYATAASDLCLEHAKLGRYHIESNEDLAESYRKTGAQSRLSDICALSEGQAVFDPALSKNIVFARHSLAGDGSLNEFHAIVARGVLPQFNMSLQFRVHNLFLASLTRLGFLCLGSSESLRVTPHERVFRQVIEGQSIYRRMR